MVPASINTKSFKCPRCHAFADQTWMILHGNPIFLDGEYSFPAKLLEGREAELYGFEKGPYVMQSRVTVNHIVENSYVSICASCRKTSLWVADKLVWPEPSSAPAMNIDTPEALHIDYSEAAAILHKSPRGSAALLRLAIQKLCQILGEPGRNINDDIASLVKKGLDSRVQKALDALRVIGNEAVHPGTLDLNDDPATAESLFRFFNLIVEKMISEPKHVDEVYALLPPEKLKAIERRDNAKD